MENVKENNTLIAEFMGAKKTITDSFEYDVNNPPDNQFFQYWHESKLKYHDSYDWLIPVVEKIEILGYFTEIRSNNNGFEFTIYHKFFNKIVYSKTIDKRITSVYSGIVEFIKNNGCWEQ